MEVPLLDLNAQYARIRDEVRLVVDEILESQKFILGTHVAALEDEVARYCGASHAIGVASGTDALLLALKALGVGQGDSVITVPFTFFASAGAVANLGARPLFVDIEDKGFNMDPAALGAMIEKECTFNLTSKQLVHRASGTRVKAVMPVHLYGQCAEMDEILEICRRYQLPVVEDACQALGARYRDCRAGAIGEVGCFSFFPTKNLGGAGDGGMIITRNKDLAARIRLLRTHGAHPKYYHAIVGFNSRLDELQAAILRVKLRHLGKWIEERRKNASDFDDGFESQGVAGAVRTPAILPHRTHIFHQYVIRCRKRDELKAFLQSRNIGTEIYYPLPLHQQECFRHLGYGAGDFPRSTQASAETLALPIYPELTSEQKNHVVRSIGEFYRQA